MDEFNEMATKIFDAIADGLDSYEGEPGETMVLREQILVVHIGSGKRPELENVRTDCFGIGGSRMPIHVKRYLNFSGDVKAALYKFEDDQVVGGLRYVEVDEATEMLAKYLRELLGDKPSTQVDWPDWPEKAIIVAFRSNPGNMILAMVSPSLFGTLSRHQVW